MGLKESLNVQRQLLPVDGLVNSQNAIDLTAVITTPENIQFEYRIAGPFRRLPALLLDFAIRVIFFVLVGFLSLVIGVSVPFSGPVITLLFMIFWFGMEWFYGLFFEAYWNGQTPGKYLTQIRVISIDGRPINIYQATVRNFLRLADIAPMVSLEMFSPDAPPAYMIPTFLVSLICMSLTTRFQRLGDIAAGTMVIVNERSWAPANVKLEDPRIVSLSEFIPANFRMSSTLAKAVALYAERRSRIPVPRRVELAMHLAKPLLKRFNFREDTSPDLLLCALYYREFVSKQAFSGERPVGPSLTHDHGPAGFDLHSSSSVVVAMATDASLPPPIMGNAAPTLRPLSPIKVQP